MRLLCGLSQLDVFAGTGIHPRRLSLAERERVRLKTSEEALVLKFLRDRWNALHTFDESIAMTSPDVAM